MRPMIYKSDVASVRAMVRAIAKKHGMKVHVREGKGSMRNTISVHGAYNQQSVPFRVEVCEALKRAGYDGVNAWAGHTLDQEIALSHEWGHGILNVSVIKAG